MLEITCSGTPYEIGQKHGSQAARLVRGSIKFYEEYFQRKSKLTWPSAMRAAEKYLPFLEQHVPHLVEEMRGVADGAGFSFLSILALNTRSEISMGLMDDGCTSVAWKTDRFSVAGQNWDWEDPQKERLVLLHIRPNQDNFHPKPSISQVTEAGIIGKIGLNSSGVAVFLNAIRARGVNYQALPLHLTFRVAMESTSRLKAVAKLRSLGSGTSGHILIADITGATSLEFTHYDIVQMEMANGQIAHTNHFLAEHNPPVTDSVIFPDTFTRMERIQNLLHESWPQPAQSGNGAVSALESMLADEMGYPASINRRSSGPENMSSTLFSIVTDLHAKTAAIRIGRPTECEEIVRLDLSGLQSAGRVSRRGVDGFGRKHSNGHL
ncbi:Acyl-coenzyme A:6-aminopenicillanic-acid-acyltransferase 40 kDa form [Cladobotryum mycophilum]|uniref:Acyl-coenzyme A:6-aminopenicillanic-acid-acyltransferase 40 kDa form n=1 Tax=Cladobotryum mycophilum TaxID=491253 RepID=A0ABR0SR82_9HYPO